MCMCAYKYICVCVCAFIYVSECVSTCMYILCIMYLCVCECVCVRRSCRNNNCENARYNMDISPRELGQHDGGGTPFARLACITQYTLCIYLIVGLSYTVYSAKRDYYQIMYFYFPALPPTPFRSLVFMCVLFECTRSTTYIYILL